MTEERGIDRRSLMKIAGATAAASVLFSGGAHPASAMAAGASARPMSASAWAGRSSIATGARKIISYGWDFPGPVFLRDNIQTMETKPFDGVVFNLYENRILAGGTGGPPYATTINPFNPAPIPAGTIDLAVLGDIEWDAFTDNFLSLWTGAPFVDMNWFNDTAWATIVSNLGQLAGAVVAAGAKGFFFDPEDYGNHQWSYSAALYPGKTYAQVCEKVRQRGQDFILALQAVKPDIKILMAAASSWGRYFGERYASIGATESSPYATFVAFMDGMYSELHATADIIDGSESDYYFDESTKWFASSRYNRGATYQFSDEGRAGYLRSSIASAVYADLDLGHLPGLPPLTPNYYPDLTASDFQMWYEHNIYHGLLKTDEYVWIYAEKMQWWLDNAYAGAEDGIRAARSKFDQSLPLGYDLSKQVGYADRHTRPAVVSSPVLTLSGATHGATVAAGATLVLTAAPSSPVIHRVEFYDSGDLVDESVVNNVVFGSGSPFVTGMVVTAGAHTFVARGFFDGGHVTSNAIVVRAT